MQKGDWNMIEAKVRIDELHLSLDLDDGHSEEFDDSIL